MREAGPACENDWNGLGTRLKTKACKEEVAVKRTRLNRMMVVLWVVILGLFTAQPAAAEYVDNHNGTVTDTVTGLTWQQGDAQNDDGWRTWEQALAYCEGLSLAERTDWRLPNIRELRSLVDYSRYDPAIDPLFACRPGGYWSGTTVATNPDYAWGVGFYYGHGSWGDKVYYRYVRCVRGGPSGSFDHLIISSIASPQATGVAFPVTITATNANGATDTSFNGTVVLSSSAGAVSPSSATLKNGTATVSVKITSPGVGTYLTASGMGKSGRSNSFTVSGGGLDSGYVMGFVKGSLGLPVSGATVYISNDCHSDSRTTNSNGYFEFRNIPCSEYSIRAEKDAASSQTDLLKVTDTACNFKELIISSVGSGGKVPILLLPGIMGSSTGKGGPYPTLPKDAPTAWNSAEWGGRKTKGLHDPLGLAGWRDLIKDLEAEPYGYELDVNLFAVPYDWRMDWDKAAEKYLGPAIAHALEKTGQGSDGKVNIIAHSMGGLLVRAHIQGSEQRKNQINKLAMVGTPNHGSANPYYMWFGGDPKTIDDLQEEDDDLHFYKKLVNFYSNTTELAYEEMHDGKRLFPQYWTIVYIPKIGFKKIQKCLLI
jgi:hypothetical protein